VASAIGSYLPTHHVRSAHQIQVHAPAAVTYQALRGLDIGRSIPISVLLAIRALPRLMTGKARPSRSITVETFLQAGLTFLEERPPREFVLGAVGRFWRPDSGLVRVAPEEFRLFDEPGYAKGALTFIVEENGSGSLLATETRVACTDPSALRKFSLYWRVIGPFSGLIRRLMLDQRKRTAEEG
jgi:hypothetical protein